MRKTNLCLEQRFEVTATSGAKTIKVTPLLAAAQEKTPVATSDKAIRLSYQGLSLTRLAR